MLSQRTGATQRSHLQHYFFYFALEKGFSIEAVLTATLKPINRHQQTYSQSFVMPLPKYKPKRQVTDTNLGPLFSCSSL